MLSVRRSQRRALAAASRSVMRGAMVLATEAATLLVTRSLTRSETELAISETCELILSTTRAAICSLSSVVDSLTSRAAVPFEDGGGGAGTVRMGPGAAAAAWAVAGRPMGPVAFWLVGGTLPA